MQIVLVMPELLIGTLGIIFVKTQEPELNVRLKVCLGVKYRKCRRGRGNQPSMDKTLVSLPLNIVKP